MLLVGFFPSNCLTSLSSVMGILHFHDCESGCLGGNITIGLRCYAVSGCVLKDFESWKETKC